MTTWTKTVIHSFGKPTDVLKIEQVTTGLPVPGDDEQVFKLIYTPIHPSNIYAIMGVYGETRPALPLTPGTEFVATLVAAGKNVPADKAKVGSRYLVCDNNGGWSEYIVKNWKTSLVLELPAEIADDQAAQVIINGLSAYTMLFNECSHKDGDWFIQSAAGSALGRILAQLAKAKGLNLINIVRRPEQAKELQDGGEIAFTFDGTNKTTVIEQIKKTAGGKGPKWAFDAVGGSTGELLFDSLCFGGLLLVYGVLDSKPIPVDSGKALFRQLTVKGYWLAPYFGTPAFTKALAEYVQLLKNKQVIVPVGEIFALKDVHAAIAESNRSGKPGKVLLKP